LGSARHAGFVEAIDQPGTIRSLSRHPKTYPFPENEKASDSLTRSRVLRVVAGAKHLPGNGLLETTEPLRTERSDGEANASLCSEVTNER
jgi:hypothetical protein